MGWAARANKRGANPALNGYERQTARQRRIEDEKREVNLAKNPPRGYRVLTFLRRYMHEGKVIERIKRTLVREAA